MIPLLVEKRRRELAVPCQLPHERRFELFGSAAAERFDPTRGDLDEIERDRTVLHAA